MDRTRTRTVRRFAERLQAVVDDTVRGAKTVEYEFANVRRTSAAEKEKVVEQVQKDLNEADSTIHALVSISQAAPAASQILDFAFARLSLIDEVLDVFERRLQSEFGVPPVAVSSIGNEVIHDSASEPNSNRSMRRLAALEMPATPRAERTTQENVKASESRMFTPKTMGQREPSSVLNVSKTPRMEDFGIDVEKVRELREQSNSFLHGSTGQFDTSLFGGGYDDGLNVGSMKITDSTYDWREESYPQDIQRSMREQGIETQQEVTERFHTRRNMALQNVLQNCTPRLKSGTAPHLDLTQFAAGYNIDNAAAGGGRAGRELDFDEEE